MVDEHADPAEEVVITSAKPLWTLGYLLLAGGALAFVILGVARGTSDFGEVLTVIFWLSLAVLLLWRAWTHRGVRLVLAPGVLSVQGAAGTRRYTSGELIEVGWLARSSISGVVVRPTGGPFDSPGPNDPRLLITLPTHGQQAQERARREVAAWCTRHGVDFTADARAMLDSAPPGSPYRRDRRDGRMRRWWRRLTNR